MRLSATFESLPAPRLTAAVQVWKGGLIPLQERGAFATHPERTRLLR
jgi:hypothetical protein